MLEKTHGKPAPAAAFHYEFCFSFPQQNAHTTCSVELNFYQNIISLLLSTDLDFVTTISLNLGPGDVPKKSE